MAKLALTALWIATCGSSILRAQTLEVNPSRALIDQSAVIRATGLDPNERVTIQAHLIDGGGHAWSSEAEFVAGASGIVDASKQPPTKGSYTEISPMGLIWAMMPTEKHVASYQFPNNEAPQVIDFALLRQGHQVATAQLEQLAVANDLRITILRGHLHGMFFAPNTAGPHPGVLVVGGSEGGLPSEKAAWLASRGFAALALAYFHYEDLPLNLAAIPLEYFGQALGWMMQRPEIAPERLAVMGTSRGGELALQLGSMYPQIKAVVAYVPANVRYPACCGNTAVPYAWTWKGQPLTYAMPRLKDNPMTELAAEIAVERTNGPLLLIGGKDDGVWPSSTMVKAIADRLHRSQFRYRVEILEYPHAGHRAGRPEIVPTWHGKMRHPISGREMDVGGSARGDAESSLDAIPKVLGFLNDALGQGAGR
jgi:dienelactone hydrolase